LIFQIRFRIGIRDDKCSAIHVYTTKIDAFYVNQFNHLRTNGRTYMDYTKLFIVMTMKNNVYHDKIRKDNYMEYTGQTKSARYDKELIVHHNARNLCVLRSDNVTKEGKMFLSTYVSNTEREEKKAPVFILDKNAECPIVYKITPQQQLTLEPKWLTLFKYGMIPVDNHGNPVMNGEANKKGFIICKHMYNFSNEFMKNYFDVMNNECMKKTFVKEVIKYLNKENNAFNKAVEECVSINLSGDILTNKD